MYNFIIKRKIKTSNSLLNKYIKVDINFSAALLHFEMDMKIQTKLKQYSMLTTKMQ